MKLHNSLPRHPFVELYLRRMYHMYIYDAKMFVNVFSNLNLHVAELVLLFILCFWYLVPKSPCNCQSGVRYLILNQWNYHTQQEHVQRMSIRMSRNGYSSLCRICISLIKYPSVIVPCNLDDFPNAISVINRAWEISVDHYKCLTNLGSSNYQVLHYFGAIFNSVIFLLHTFSNTSFVYIISSMSKRNCQIVLSLGTLNNSKCYHH